MATYPCPCCGHLVFGQPPPRGAAAAPWPDDLTVRYCWRPTFWRRTGS